MRPDKAQHIQGELVKRMLDETGGELPKPLSLTESVYRNIDNPVDTRERLAEYAHDAWAGWMAYLFEKGSYNSDGSFTIHPQSVKRWKRQMNTTYKNLPDGEKNSDRKEADRILQIVQGQGE